MAWGAREHHKDEAGGILEGPRKGFTPQWTGISVQLQGNATLVEELPQAEGEEPSLMAGMMGTRGIYPSRPPGYTAASRAGYRGQYSGGYGCLLLC